MQNKKKFENSHVRPLENWVRKIVLWKFGLLSKTESYLKAPKDFSFPVKLSLDSKKPWAVRLNHSTFLLKIEDIHFLTDPIFSSTCSPFSFLGPRRAHAPALKLSEIPKIDLVFISHNHYDHFDKSSCLKLSRRFPEVHFIVPLGLKKWFLRKKLNVSELNWWESVKIKDFQITAVPAQHFSGRKIFDTDQTLWAGFVAEGLNKKIYFAGDTGYNPIDFKKIGEKFNGFDLSLLPIGAYEPRSLMKPIHIDPKEAIQVHKETFSKLSLAMHYGTFKLTDEEMTLPPYELFVHLRKADIPLEEFMALRPGEYVNF